MAKPATFDGYSDQYTADCERVLVTLLRGLGPWKESVFLVGGLTPRYLVASRPPEVPAHAGTLDVDIVIDLQILADTEGYRTLEENLRAMGFERSTNERGQRLSWRWQTRTENGALMVVELLADAPEIAGGRVEPLPTKGNISALNIPHSSIVFEMHQVAEIRAELLGGAGTCQGRRETRPKGGAKCCHRGRGGEVVRGGRDLPCGGGCRKRREGVARPEFPAQDRPTISSWGMVSARGCG